MNSSTIEAFGYKVFNRQLSIVCILLVAALLSISGCQQTDEQPLVNPEAASTSTATSTPPQPTTVPTTAPVLDPTATPAPQLSDNKTTVLKHVFALVDICKLKKLNWSIVEVENPAKTGVIDCYVRAAARLSEFAPLILYGGGGIELRRVPEGREFYFRASEKTAQKQSAPLKESAEYFMKLRKELSLLIPDGKTDILSSPESKNSSALRVRSTNTAAMKVFITSLTGHLHSLSVRKNEDGTEEIEAIIELASEGHP